MVHLEALFTRDGISFNRHDNRVRYVILLQKENSMLTFRNSCFPHVINLAVQAIYAALKDGKGLDEQYLLGNVDDANEAALKGVALPKGVTIDGYRHVLKADVLGMARKLIAACRLSGKRREDFVDTIIEGNLNKTWVDDDGNLMSRKALQLLRDCETRWSSTHNMVDRVLTMLPVCFLVTNNQSP